MIKTRLYIIVLLLILICPSLDAQTKRGTSRKRVRTTEVQTQKEEEKKDTIVATPVSEEPKHKSLSDPLVVRYLRGGFVKENKLYLVTNADYESLTMTQKQDVLNRVAREFSYYDMTIYSSGQQRELWINSGNGVQLLEHWNNDSLRIENYLPLELKRQGPTKVFYYIGGFLNGGNGSTSYGLNLRVGSYLYKNLLDASATFNLGGSKTNGNSQFNGDIGIDSRAYLPFRIKNVNLAPYVGAGISWVFAPESFFELRLLAGGCWFVGPGSFDIGLQYGTKSNFALTLGYTFRIPIKKKQK